MKNVLKNLAPERLFGFFEEISAIPRGSGNEKGIADYVERFAKDRGLYCKRDGYNNVFVRKPASKGRENEKSVLLDAHTDMVCVAKEGKTVDFLNEPIELMTDGRYIFANGTSLGADDGVGVAVMLALIDDSEISLPETEYLFTSSEETGMDGAEGFDYSEVRSERVINLDSEEEFNACIGCAGGMHVKAVLPAERVKTEGKLCEITISGLAGGHSGVDVDKGRQNAIKLLALVLDRFYEIYPFHVVSLSGGERDNVIPSSASAIVSFADNVEAKKAKTALADVKKDITATLSKDDRRGFNIKFYTVGNTSDRSENTVSDERFDGIVGLGMLSLKSTSTLISALILSPQGVTDRYSGKVSGVAGSVNLGIVSVSGESSELHYLIRSGNPVYSERTHRAIKRLAHVCGGRLELVGSYPGWDSKDGEPLQGVYATALKELFGREAVFSRVHAGLECGIISEKLKACGLTPEIISIGPNNESIHSPSERIEIESFRRFYEIVKRMLL